MELKNISGSVHYIPNSSNIGVIIKNKNCVLIDTGLDSDTGKKILKLLEEKNLCLKAIINTHAHADHFGGNKIIKEKTNCLVCAPKIEACIIENPILESLLFFSGAEPLPELKNKFLMAEPCEVDKIIENGTLEIENFSMQITNLPGHSINQIGIIFEGVIFCGDSFFSKETIEKHKIPFFVNIEETKKTLNSLKETNYSTYAPSHVDPQNNVKEIINENLKTIEKIENAILEILQQSKSTEQTLKQLARNFKIKITSVQQYYLLKTSLLAYLEYLSKNKRIKTEIENNQLQWIRL
ncbi:MAG: MBL fold metallo-hydrolase [Candidatus ainarchaeum sp.]|nr:MBL fold metallo-hydrolase [Candidatus ainarchaeum sp.]